jgi:hypothetical protein
MALDKPTFNQQIRKAYSDGWKTFIAVLDNNAASNNPVAKPQPVAIEQASDVFANQVADAIDSYIKSATVTVNAGIDVIATISGTGSTGGSTTGGTGAAPLGKTAEGTATIS